MTGPDAHDYDGHGGCCEGCRQCRIGQLEDRHTCLIAHTHRLRMAALEQGFSGEAAAYANMLVLLIGQEGL
jgi:hypothetical protein